MWRPLGTLSIILFVLFSCTKEVVIDIPGFKEQLVVDGKIETDKFPVVILSMSQNIYAPTDLEAYLQTFVSDALVSVSNGTETIDLELFPISALPLETRKTVAEMLRLELNEVIFLPIQVYSTTNESLRGELGKTYTLNIEHGGKSYTGETSLLTPVPLVNSYWKPDPDNSFYGYCFARLSDPGGVYNAYKWEAKRINTLANGQPYDVIFRSGSDPYFDDEFWDGLTFEFDTRYPKRDTLQPEEYRRHYKLGDTVVIKMSRIERDVHEFFDKRDAQLSSAGNPFASPVNLPSNIKGGCLGVWAGISPWYDTLYCFE
jgi:hypothetical protein